MELRRAIEILDQDLDLEDSVFKGDVRRSHSDFQTAIERCLRAAVHFQNFAEALVEFLPED